MSTVTFGPGLSFSGAATVFTKARWDDDWTERPSMSVERVVWSLWPSLPVAEILFKYGKIALPGETTFSTVAKADYLGHFVKIEIEAEDGGLLWVGFVDEKADYQGGVDTIAYGRQLLTCYSLSQVLGLERFRESFWWDAGASQVRTAGSAIAFNANGKPNRTPSKPTTSHLFSSDPLFAEFWSSRDIAEYILDYHMPKDDGGALKIEWALENLTFLPDWDSPTIETDRATILQILNQVIDRRYFLSAFDSYEDDGTDQTAKINVVSLATAIVDLGSSREIPAATTQHDIVLWNDPATSATVQTSASGMYHQVIARGAKRTTTVTLSVGTGLYKSWDSTDVTAYNTAASTHVDYAAQGSYQRDRMNEIARAQPKLAHVYRLLELRHTDDFTVNLDGFGNEPIFQDDALTPNRHYAFFHSIEIEPTIPLYHGVDYSGNAVENIDSLTFTQRTLRLPLIMFERPDFGGDPLYAAVSELGRKWLLGGANDDVWFSIDARIADDKKGLFLDVSGAQQHVIAGTQFVALSDDTDPKSQWDIGTTLATIALRDDRYAEAVYPASPAVSVDVLRKLVLDMGEGFRTDFVIPGTTVGVDPDGALKQSEGGFIRDDRDKLLSVAKSAAEWYTKPRSKLLLSSSRVTAVLRVGDLVTKINDGTLHENTINTTISEISLVIGESPGPARSVRFSLQTANAELDPLIFLPKEPIV